VLHLLKAESVSHGSDARLEKRILVYYGDIVRYFDYFISFVSGIPRVWLCFFISLIQVILSNFGYFSILSIPTPTQNQIKTKEADFSQADL
jgi:hypothetical protein